MRDLIGITYDAVSGGPELTAAEWRQTDTGLFVRDTNDLVLSGVRGGAVTNTGFSATVAPLTAVVQTTAALGAYIAAFPAGATELAKTINAAHATLPRVDAIDVKIFDHEADASTFRGADIQYNAGTANASPVAPTFTGVGVRLGTFAVPASGGGNPVWTISPALIGYAGSGGVLEVTNDPANPRPGTMTYNRTAKILKYWDGTNWNILAGGSAVVAAISSTDELAYTSTAFGAGAAPLGIVFVAPPSGSGFITLGAYFSQSQNLQASIVSYTVRAGGSIGSGTTVGTAANSDRALVCGRSVNASAPALLQADIRDYWSGLTPGATYNARVEFQVTSGGNMDVLKRKLIFEPSL